MSYKDDPDHHKNSDLNRITAANHRFRFYQKSDPCIFAGTNAKSTINEKINKKAAFGSGI
jgi:hypothetical protein